MVIDLFKKGDGLRCLKEIYNLSDSQITRIEDSVFEYETPPMSIKEIDELITSLQTLPGETEAEIKNVKAYDPCTSRRENGPDAVHRRCDQEVKDQDRAFS